jgi:uncharacterized protein
MYALVTMCLSLAVLVVLLWFKVRLGRAMMLTTIALAMLLRLTPNDLWRMAVYEWQNKPITQTTGYLFMTLAGLIVLVGVLGEALKVTGVSARLGPALNGLLRSRRFALAVMPMIMGLLPVPGGIMLSSPMVRELGDSIGLNRTRQAAINFVFRHQWEPVWPLFPSVPLIQGMLGVSAFAVISHNLVIMLSFLAGGTFFLLLPAMPSRKEASSVGRMFGENLRDFAGAIWPIAVVAGLYIAFNITPAVGMLPAIIIFLIFHRVPMVRWGELFKAGIDPDFILLIFGSLLFKLNLEAGNVITDVVQFLIDVNVPPYLLIFILPFIVAFSTGVTLPTVAITFPFLIPFIGTGGQAKMGLEVLAFAGLICGLFLSPIHLCVALSASYFEVPLSRLILKIAGPVILIAVAGAAMAILYNPY